MNRKLSESRSISTSLLEKLKAGEGDAASRFVQLFTPLVYSWCRKAGLNATDSADVAQEVFRAVMNSVGGFSRSDRDRSTFMGWLWTITKSKLSDHRARREKQPQAIGGTTAHARIEEVPEPEWDDSISSQHQSVRVVVQQALKMIRPEFQEKTWQAFWLVRMEEQDPADVAARLEMQRNAVYKASTRVLKRLRQILGESLGEDWDIDETPA